MQGKLLIEVFRAGIVGEALDIYPDRLAALGDIDEAVEERLALAVEIGAGELEVDGAGAAFAKAAASVGDSAVKFRNAVQPSTGVRLAGFSSLKGT